MRTKGSDATPPKPAAIADAEEVDSIEVLDEEVPRFIPPWFAQPDDDEDQDNGENYIVVSYCYSDENPIICVGHKHWPLDKETATLISAAPEMFEALKDALWALDNMSAILSAAKIESTLDDPRPSIRAALSKATGAA